MASVERKIVPLNQEFGDESRVLEDQEWEARGAEEILTLIIRKYQTRLALSASFGAPEGLVLLEQKPMEGLWGGLWTPPERTIEYSPIEFLREVGLAETDTTYIHVAPRFRHTFTHLFLDIEPVYIQLDAAAPETTETPITRWVSPDRLISGKERIGLAAPAVKLLSSLKEVLSEHAQNS
mgnify:CR=1 FL=1